MKNALVCDRPNSSSCSMPNHYQIFTRVHSERAPFVLEFHFITEREIGDDATTVIDMDREVVTRLVSEAEIRNNSERSHCDQVKMYLIVLWYAFDSNFICFDYVALVTVETSSQRNVKIHASC